MTGFFTGDARRSKGTKPLDSKGRGREIHFSDLLRLLREGGVLPSPVARYVQTLVFRRVLERDCGICAKCHLPTFALAAAISWYAEHRQAEMVTVAEFKRAIGRRARRWPGRLFDTDHITPVSKGGALLALSNLRTLCLQCHYEVTAQMKRERADREIR